jgi:uncharacterized RDD family membrane protein YckC
MSTAEWYYLQNGQQIGPVGSSQLRTLATRGRLQPHDLIWRDGLTQWVPASRVKGLFPAEEYTLIEDEPPPAVPPRSTTADDASPREARRPRKAPRHGYAGFWKRLAAFLVDTIVLAGVGFCVGFAFGFVMVLALGPRLDQDVLQLASFGLGFLINFLYYAILESSESQATPGKRVLHIKVTDEDGRRITFARATGRYFAKLLSFVILGVGCLMAAFTPRKQALHDSLAHTLVIND